MTEQARAPKSASAHTCAHHRGTCAGLDFSDRVDFEEAGRGFIATMPEVVIRATDGRVVWSLADYAFLSAPEPPDTVHPSLWRQARLNMHNGLFQVTDRIYQVRGYDISNMTIVEGATGLILIDPLISAETARASLELYRTHRGHRPVVAVIYSHSHVDHYGGVRGVIDEVDVAAGRVRVIAPDRFIEEVTKENVLAGTVMIRRAQFQFGATLPRGPRQQIDAGLGKVTSRGTVTLIPPTDLIREPIETRIVDGVEIVFQLAPDTEAPAEMHMFFPGLKALNLAENATHNLHNIYPIRGAQVRDANAWAKYLAHALHSFAPKSEVVFAQHHWPVWGQSRLTDFLSKQRVTYKFLHDQTLRLMNKGLKPAEIAERIALPDALHRSWHARGYYGTLSYNAKAISQRYIGWYDGHPASLNPLPPVARGAKYVAYMGGADALLARARRDFEAGDYRFVADVLSHLVYAEPEHAAARALLADAFEQLGYQSESATWRNAYLLGAHELRSPPPGSGGRTGVSPDMVRALSLELFFDYLAIRLNPDRAAGHAMVLGWDIADRGETATLTLSNAALTYIVGHRPDAADAIVSLDRATLDRVILRQTTVEAAITAGEVRVAGDAAKVIALFAMFDDFALMYPVITSAIDGITPRTV
jgi:alkyl sulfatase BDS1-like metallo-beta-lactamase superfamily hydrolase